MSTYLLKLSTKYYKIKYIRGFTVNFYTKGISMIDFSDLTNAEQVFKYFLEISKIPHGSGNTSHIADYLERFATERSLEHYRDTANNVIIKKPATAGYESRPTVILQGHTDMVAEKLPSSTKDMSTEGLDVYRDGDFLRAEGTTLGGDDGVAVAYCLALLDSNDIPHPAIEALFTSDEEIGLIGAGALDTSRLEGKVMINIDSDDEGIFTVGCAGGVRNDIKLKLSTAPSHDKKYKLTVSGLLGGHSGVEIDRGRANAIKLLAATVCDMDNLRIHSIYGGNADNAIPRECTALFTTSDDAEKWIDFARAACAKTYAETDPDICFTLEEAEFDSAPLDKDSTDKLISIINDTPSGVIAMSQEIKGLPESSQNIGIVKIEDGFFKMTVSVRSAKVCAKSELARKIQSTAEKYGAEYSSRGDYPAWEYKPDSLIRDVCCNVFREMYKKDASVIIIHAGLECGIFSGKIKGLDCISLGPDNYDIHTTEEHLSVSSTARVWEFLKRVLKEI